jgi:hypothetical protein
MNFIYVLIDALRRRDFLTKLNFFSLNDDFEMAYFDAVKGDHVFILKFGGPFDSDDPLADPEKGRYALFISDSDSPEKYNDCLYLDFGNVDEKAKTIDSILEGLIERKEGRR